MVVCVLNQGGRFLLSAVNLDSYRIYFFPSVVCAVTLLSLPYLVISHRMLIRVDSLLEQISERSDFITIDIN